MAVLPTRLLEIEFDAGVWTDVFADVVDVASDRGRNRELGAYETGTLRVTLRNDARTYDPDYAAGPYYGKLRPNRRVRFRATYDAVTYPVFLGYIDRIEQVYGGPNDAAAVIDVSDRFKILNRIELPDSVYGVELAADTPTWWFRLGEPSGSDTVRDVAGTATLEAFGAPELGAASVVVRDPDTALGQADATTGFSALGSWITAGATPITLEAWIQTTTTAEQTIVSVGDGGEGMRARLYVTATGKAGWSVGKTVAGNTSAGNAGGSVTVNDGAPHHLVGVYTAGGAPNLQLYVDGGAAQNGDLVPSAFGSGSQELCIGNAGVGWILPEAHASGLIGTVDEVALYMGNLTSGQAAAHNTAGRTPWDGDLPGERLERILALAGVDAADYTLDAGTTTLQSTDLGGDALSYAQKVEQTDLGAFFVARDGELRFLARGSLITGDYLTTKATLVDHTGGGIPYRSSSADVDEAALITRATVSRAGSIAVTYADAVAVAEFQAVDATYEGLLHDDDAYSLSYAQWIVSTHKDPRSRLGRVELALTRDPDTMYPGILDLELGDRVAYVRQPQNVGTAITLDMRVDAISHETGGAYWTTRLQLSPFNPGEGGLPVGVWDETDWDQSVWGI